MRVLSAKKKDKFLIDPCQWWADSPIILMYLQIENQNSMHICIICILSNSLPAYILFGCEKGHQATHLNIIFKI